MNLNLGAYLRWSWAILASLMTLSLAGETMARDAAMTLAVLQAVGFLLVHRSLRHFPTQLRAAYALWMTAGLIPHLFVLYLILTAGTVARVLTGYCAMARLLLLLPWNRSVPLTWRRVGVIAFHPPTRGSVLNELPL